MLATLKGEEYRDGYSQRYVNDVDVSSDGRLLATAERRGTVNIYQVKDGKQVGTLKHGGQVDCVRFSRDGRRLASSGSDTSTLVWDVEAALAAKPEETK